MMRKNYIKGMVAIICMALSLGFGDSMTTGNITIPQANAAPSTANMMETDIEAIGIGLPPDNTSSVRAATLARRAAIVDAQRTLAEAIQGVRVDSETTMQDLSIASDTVKTQVSEIGRAHV